MLRDFYKLIVVLTLFIPAVGNADVLESGLYRSIAEGFSIYDLFGTIKHFEGQGERYAGSFELVQMSARGAATCEISSQPSEFSAGFLVTKTKRQTKIRFLTGNESSAPLWTGSSFRKRSVARTQIVDLTAGQVLKLKLRLRRSAGGARRVIVTERLESSERGQGQCRFTYSGLFERF